MNEKLLIKLFLLLFFNECSIKYIFIIIRKQIIIYLIVVSIFSNNSIDFIKYILDIMNKSVSRGCIFTFFFLIVLFFIFPPSYRLKKRLFLLFFFFFWNISFFFFFIVYFIFFLFVIFIFYVSFLFYTWY